MNEPTTLIETLPRVMGYTGTWIIGGICMKRYAEAGAPMDFAASVTASAFGMALAVPLLKATGIGLTMAMTSALYIVAMAVIGAVAFGERMTATQVAGITLACASVILMALPSASATKPTVLDEAPPSNDASTPNA